MTIKKSISQAGSKRILVTGGAGFLGSHLVDRLMGQGHWVTVLDNLSTGHLDNLAHHSSNPRLAFMQHDIALAKDIAVDQIYNLACPASPVRYQADPLQTFKTSVLGALTVLGLGAKHGATVFQASTSEVYGDPNVHPQTEAYWGHVNPIGVRSCYDESKRAAETLFFDYHRQHGVHIKVARIFNTYGPRMDPEDGRVVANFIVQALRGEPLTLYGDGLQTRSFCYVDDLIDGFLRLMNAPTKVTGPVNLGNPDEFTVRELAETVVALTGSRSTMEFRPLPADDPRQRKPDIAFANDCLNWRPSVALREGLLRTIEYFDRRLAAA